jgi:hypothetical protein
MQKPRLDFTPHETILEVVVYNIPGSRLNGDYPNLDLLIVAPALCLGLTNTKQVASCRSSFIWTLDGTLESLDVVYVRPFGVEICQLSNERGIPIVSSSFQCCCLELAYDSHFMASCNKSFDMNMEPMNRDTC